MNVLVFQHVDVEHPGVFREFWREKGHVWQAVELDQGDGIPELDAFDLLVVMGGPMDVWQEAEHPWLRGEKDTIRRWVVELGKPFLGVCLGHQLLAAALGGEVTPMAVPEVGLLDVQLTEAGRQDPLFTGFQSTLQTFQWHGSHVSRLPAGATVLAETPVCPVQAFRWGTRAYGLQYHVEITDTTVSDWASIPAYAASLERALGRERAATLGSTVAVRLPGFRASARKLYDNLALIGRF